MTVLRWHSDPDPNLRNSGDDIDRHQQSVLNLVREICECIGHNLSKSQLELAARYHDEGERVTGDIPTSIKRADPILRAALEAAEYKAMKAMNLPGFPWELSSVEWRILKLADMADAFYWAQHHTETHVPRWDDFAEDICVMAQSIDPRLVNWFQKSGLDL